MESQTNNPPENLRQGAWEIDSEKVRFALWAPGKDTVSVVGDFNQWKPEANPMKGSDDGIWWVEIELKNGDYEYMYLIDEEIYIGDPYAREVNWVDEGAHSILRIGQDPFEWSDQDFQIPARETMVIYEVHVGDFTSEGTFEAMIQYLGYLKDLGINVIELMPVFEFPGDFSWGYNPTFTMAVEKSYGTLNNFKSLVNEAHAQGIAVVLDMVFNHVDHEHPFTMLYAPDDNPFFNDKENPWGFPNLDHHSDAVKGYVHQIQEYWLKDCHIDGFRYDAAANIGYDEMNGVTFLAYDAHEIQPHVLLIAEHVPEDPHLVHSTDINALWNRSWHHSFIAQLTEQEYEGYHFDDMEQIKKVLNPKSEGYNDIFEVINFTEGHDWERIVFEVQKNDDMASSAIRKSVLGAILLFTTPGIPMILYGQEVATTIPKKSTLEGGHRPDWGEAFNDDNVKWLYECYKRLIWLRREEKVLQTEQIGLWLMDPDSRVIIYRRYVDGEEDEVIVMVNFNKDEQGFEIELPRGGKYYEVVTGEDWVLEGGKYQSTIPGSTGRVLKRIGA